MTKSEKILRESQDSIGIPEHENEKGTESKFKEIVAENFPTLGRKMDIQIHETQRT